MYRTYIQRIEVRVQSSVVRGVREGRGGKVGREFRVQTVLQSAGPRLETPQSDWRSCVTGGITCNAEGFAGETGAVDVLEGGERHHLLSCSHYPLKGLAAGHVAGAIPHSDAASQDALDGASVEGAHDGGRGSGSSEFAEEVETLLCFLGQCCSVVSPGEVLCDVYTQELGAAHSLHSRTIDGQRSMLSVHSPEVNNNLLRLLHIQREIDVIASPGQVAHLAPVVCLISVADETHHSRVIRKFNEEVGVVWRCAVVGQQSEEEGAQHTSLGGPCVQCDGAGCVTADPYCLRSPGQKVQQPVAQRRIEPQLDQFMNELLRDDCVECWTEVYEQHSDIQIFFVQMCECWVEGSGDGIIGRAVGPICKLEGVQGGGEDRLNVVHD